MPTSPTFTRYADVVAVLGDPTFEVPPVPAAGDEVDVAWLRATVSRFATGEDHARRRRLVIAHLDAIDPDDLGARAFEAAAAALAAGDSIAALARAVPVLVLADALGISGDTAADVRVVARGYQPGTDAGPAGTDAVAALVAACGGVPDEQTAARIAVLVQACDATAALIDNTLDAMRERHTDVSVERALVETLRFAPPARVMKRESVRPTTVGTTPIDGRTTVVLDLVAANRDAAVFERPDVFDPDRTDAGRHLAFGAGERPCPGSAHALAMARGVVSAVLATRRVSP